MIIRKATAEDAADIAAVHIRSWQTAYRGQLPDWFLDRLDDELPHREANWRRSAEDAWLAEADGRIAGFVFICKARDADIEPETGELGAIYLDPADWDKGYGRALMQRGESELKARGYRQAILWVLDSNERARRFYEIGGWEADGLKKTEHRGKVALNEVRYWKEL